MYSERIMDFSKSLLYRERRCEWASLELIVPRVNARGRTNVNKNHHPKPTDRWSLCFIYKFKYNEGTKHISLDGVVFSYFLNAKWNRSFFLLCSPFATYFLFYLNVVLAFKVPWNYVVSFIGGDSQVPSELASASQFPISIGTKGSPSLDTLEEWLGMEWGHGQCIAHRGTLFIPYSKAVLTLFSVAFLKNPSG